jgi:hypothetical protein
MLAAVASDQPMEALENAVKYSDLSYSPLPLPPLDRKLEIIDFVEVPGPDGQVVKAPRWADTWHIVPMNAEQETWLTGLTLSRFLVRCIDKIRRGQRNEFMIQNIELAQQGPYRHAIAREVIQETNTGVNYKLRHYVFFPKDMPPLILDFGLATAAKYWLEAKCEISRFRAERAKLRTRVFSIDGSILADFARLLGPLEEVLPWVELPRGVRIAAPEGGGDARTL